MGVSGLTRQTRSVYRNCRLASNEAGQSVLEFLFLFPMVVALAVILIRVNTIIQVSITNQKYARAHTLNLALNSSVYPNLGLRERELVKHNYNQLLIGVSDQAIRELDEQDRRPKPTKQNITRKKSPRDSQGSGGTGDEAEPRERAVVRSRVTVSLCSQTNVVDLGGRMVPVLPLTSPKDLTPSGTYNLGENTRFDFCSTPPLIKFVNGGSS